MRVTWLFSFLIVYVLNYDTISAVPLTKWFKTDNNSYYIEEREKFTWQQSYDECLKKSMALITVKAFKEDELLLQYITQNFNPKPEFWLKASDNVELKDINKLLGSMLGADFLNIKLDGIGDSQIIQTNNSDNCALTVDGTARACEALHGYICYDYHTKDNGSQNVQNIVLKFN